MQEEKEKLEKLERETAKLEELKLKEEAEMEEAREMEKQYAAKRSEAKYAELIKAAQEKGLKEMPERVELEPWAPLPPLPKSTPPKIIEIPVEPPGTGVNKKVI